MESNNIFHVSLCSIVDLKMNLVLHITRTEWAEAFGFGYLLVPSHLDHQVMVRKAGFSKALPAFDITNI